jgi:hypothetical protein
MRQGWSALHSGTAQYLPQPQLGLRWPLSQPQLSLARPLSQHDIGLARPLPQRDISLVQPEQRAAGLFTLTEEEEAREHGLEDEDYVLGVRRSFWGKKYQRIFSPKKDYIIFLARYKSVL